MEHEWDFQLLSTDIGLAAEQIQIREAVGSFVQKWKTRSDYLKHPETAQEALDEYEALLRKRGLLGNQGYAISLRHYQDEGNAEVKAALNGVDEFLRKMSNELAFFTLNLGKISPNFQMAFLKHAGLQKYRHFLERLFTRAKYTLSEQEEQILTLKEIPASEFWQRMLNGLLSKQEREITVKGKTEKKHFSALQSLLDSPDKATRDEAAQAFTEILDVHADVAEAEMNAILMNKKIDDDLRKIERPDISRHLEDDIETEIVDALIAQVSTKGYALSRKFYQLKAKLMGVKKLKYSERNVPVGMGEKEYSYADATNLVLSVFGDLDPSFKRIFEGYLKQGQIDVYPRKGKHAGAFCMHHALEQPTYILLNHDNKLRDVTTLAHELGHGINNELMKQKQHALDFDTPKSTAEVASTFMEDFVFEALLKDADKETRLILLMAKLNDDMSTIIRQIAFYRFEQEMHAEFRKHRYLSHLNLGTLFRKHMEEYLGAAVDMQGYENWWVYVPHFRYLFYVYSYASGLLISKALQRMVREKPEAIEKVKTFLSAGTSISPSALFASLGIDIRSDLFWEEGLAEIERLLIEVEELARDLGKLS
ncbi:M3 family oligoendopeptidase [Candidatus Pacearchaeota archaeon]|nr:M3 family oligoendopeptidase [Candidatus Pacearchaeota archaeon]